MDYFDEQTGRRFLRIGDVSARTGLSKTEIYRRIRQDRFPAARKLSSRVTIWIDAEILAWQRNQVPADVADLLG